MSFARPRLIMTYQAKDVLFGLGARPAWRGLPITITSRFGPVNCCKMVEKYVGPGNPEPVPRPDKLLAKALEEDSEIFRIFSEAQ